MQTRTHILYTCGIIALAAIAADFQDKLVELQAEVGVIRGRGCPDQYAGHPFLLSSVQNRTRTAVLTCYYATGVRS